MIHRPPPNPPTPAPPSQKIELISIRPYYLPLGQVTKLQRQNWCLISEVCKTKKLFFVGKCLIEVMANEAQDEKRRGQYFHFDRRDIFPIPIPSSIIHAKNSRSQKEGLIRTFDQPLNTKYDSHGRFDPRQDSSPGDWNVGDLVMIKDSKYCPTGMTSFLSNYLVTVK